jgi:hypothetical protein
VLGALAAAILGAAVRAGAEGGATLGPCPLGPALVVGAVGNTIGLFRLGSTPANTEPSILSISVSCCVALAAAPGKNGCNIGADTSILGAFIFGMLKLAPGGEKERGPTSSMPGRTGGGADTLVCAVCAACSASVMSVSIVSQCSQHWCRLKSRCAFLHTV